MIDEKVLFIGDRSYWSHSAADFLSTNFQDVKAIFWDYGEPEPTEHYEWTGDRIFTFKADLILDLNLISSAAKSAINFHPSIPDYRGVGGYYYAISERRQHFGTMCHHIVEKLDSGPIITVQRFKIAPNETVDSLIQRTASYTLILFYDIVNKIIVGEELPNSIHEKWDSTLYTRAMLNEFISQPNEIQFKFKKTA